ncbi:flagellar hook-length control protein FliK [Castellaniella caeni]|uniref:flagellar hook-length control protein FliK n=1 Tax=Castellaniella caeni TaxID=266123 RepID=UPI00083144E4|nr:flagellar hook-length control protein FliK [Castellaniella caeni]
MSIGAPSNLGTLLIQRLDQTLGTTLSQQANVVSGAGPQAVPQPGTPENPTALRNPAQRDPKESVDRAGSQGQQRAAVGKAVREMQLDNLLGRATTFRGATQSAPTTLGYAARIILALLNEFPQANQAIQGRNPLVQQSGGNTGGGTGASGGAQATGQLPPPPAAQSAAASSPGPLGSATRLWAQLASALNQPGALSAQFAQALSQSIQTSGLFYESHLAQLAAGKTTAQALQQEPQGQIRPQADPAGGADTAARPAGAPPNSLAALVQQAQPDTVGGQGQGAPDAASTATAGGTAGTQNAAVGNAPPPVPVPGIDPQSQLLVRQQLEVLANQGFVWQGEAWPGADMHWEVQRRQPDDGKMPQADQEHWATQLKLRLPTLGEVQARLSLSGTQLVMRITAPQSAARLSQAIEPLRARLSAQGLQASQLSVMAHDPADPDTAHAGRNTPTARGGADDIAAAHAMSSIDTFEGNTP